ncbi:MAG: DNA repair protein RadC [Kiloniellales bacterium]
MAQRDDREGHRRRLRERFFHEPEALPDYELLELLLCMARPRVDVKPVAKRLLRRFGGLGAVLAQDRAALSKVDGVNDASATALIAVNEAACRMLRHKAAERPVLGSWNQLLDYVSVRMGDAPREEFRVLYLDAKNKLIEDEALQKGTVGETAVYPREVVKRALELHATAFIMVHNHPSGDPTPSRADIDMTREVAEAGKALGITLHDHLIIGGRRHASFKSLGLL